LVFGFVPVELYAVVVGVVEVEGFADAVVGGAVEFDLGIDESAEGIAELRARGVEDGGVIEAGSAGRRRVSVEAFPGVEADVVVVSAGGDERGAVAEGLHELEAEDADIEVERALKVGDLKVDVTDADGGVDGGGHGRMIAWG